MSKYRTRFINSTPPAEISGLQVVLQRRTKKQRAQLALAIERGETRLTSLTERQIAAICNVSTTYIHKLTDRTPAIRLVEAAE
jgi:hypothetical protein